MEKTSINCPSCGTKLTFEGELDDLECLICGEMIKLPPAKPSTVGLSVKTTAPTNKSNLSYEQAPKHLNENSASVESQKQQNTKSNKRWIILGGASIAVLSIVVLFFLIGGNSSSKSAPQSIDSELFEVTPKTVREEKNTKSDTASNDEKSTVTTLETEKKKTHKSPQSPVDTQTSHKPPKPTKLPFASKKVTSTSTDNEKPTTEKKTTVQDDSSSNTSSDDDISKNVEPIPVKKTPRPPPKRSEPAWAFLPENIKNTIVDKYDFSDKAMTEGRKLSARKIKKMVVAKAEKLTQLEFTAKMKSAVIKKAVRMYVPFKVGERVSVRMRSGGGYQIVKGTFSGIYGSKVKIGFRYVPLIDMDKKTKDRFYPDKMRSCRKEYLQHKFYNPKHAVYVNYRNKIEQEMFKAKAFIFNRSYSRWEHVDKFIKSTTTRLRGVYYKLLKTIKNIKNLQSSIADTKGEYVRLNEKLRSLRQERIPTVFTLYGYIISDEGKNIYEIAETTYSYSVGGRIPTRQHAFLKTTGTSFSSKGHFSLDVLILTNIPVSLKREYGGFKQNWTVYKEATYSEKEKYNSLSRYKNMAITASKRIKDLKKTLRTAETTKKRYERQLNEYNAIKTTFR
jgi:hypothetical protein